MAQEINLGGTIYVSSKRAAEITGYAQDYIGQLARSGQIEGRRVAGLWYVLEESLRGHKHKADEFVPTPPERAAAPIEASVSFDGKDYISASRAAKITGYSQDYVGQLARSEKIPSRQIGNRWYVDRMAISEHKRYNDSLLGAVQAESVGVMRPDTSESAKFDAGTIQAQEPHFNYIPENVPIMPIPEEIAESQRGEEELAEVTEEERQIPIRVVAPVTPIEQPAARAQYRDVATTATTSRITMFFIAFLGIFIFAAGVVTFVDIPNVSAPQAVVSTANVARSAMRADGIDTAASRFTEFAGRILAKEIEYHRSN